MQQGVIALLAQLSLFAAITLGQVVILILIQLKQCEPLKFARTGDIPKVQNHLEDISISQVFTELDKSKLPINALVIWRNKPMEILFIYIVVALVCGGICFIFFAEDEDSSKKVLAFAIGALLGPLGIVVVIALKLAKK